MEKKLACKFYVNVFVAIPAGPEPKKFDNVLCDQTLSSIKMLQKYFTSSHYNIPTGLVCIINGHGSYIV